MPVRDAPQQQYFSVVVVVFRERAPRNVDLSQQKPVAIVCRLLSDFLGIEKKIGRVQVNSTNIIGNETLERPLWVDPKLRERLIDISISTRDEQE